MNQSLVKPSKNIAHNYRNILQSSDDEETGQSDIRVSLVVRISLIILKLCTYIFCIS